MRATQVDCGQCALISLLDGHCICSFSIYKINNAVAVVQFPQYMYLNVDFCKLYGSLAILLVYFYLTY